MNCDQLGAIQTTGTCWFFSILNGFILSEDGQKILYARLKEFYNKLSADEKVYFDDKLNAVCPMKNFKKTNEIYFWKFVDQYLCFVSGPRTESLKMGRSAKVLAGMHLQGTAARANIGTKGAHPQQEIANILEHVGFTGKFDMRYAEKKVAFDSRKKPQFVVVSESDWIPTAYMERIPKAFMENKDYSLMCASIAISNTLANNREQHKGHALSGYLCNGKGFIYDSNQKKIFRCDWWDRADLKKVVDKEISLVYPFFKGGQVNYFAYSFAIFSRKEFVKNIAPACLMKYKTKTPPMRVNFTSPNLGARLNNPMLFTYLKPAERIALKRKWARTEKRKLVDLPAGNLNFLIRNATSSKNAMKNIQALKNAGYSIKQENYNKFVSNLKSKFPEKTYTFAEAKAYMNTNKFKRTAALRKYHYSLVWKGIPLAQRKVLMHFRNKGEWLANNAFENKAKPPIKHKPKPKTLSPRTKRATEIRAGFEKYWLELGPNNRKVVRNYVAAHKSPSPPKPSPSPNQRYSPKSPSPNQRYSPKSPSPNQRYSPKSPSPNQRYSPKSPSPPKPKPKSPSPNPTKPNSPNVGSSNQPLRNATAHVNTLKTAVARKGYLKLRALNMSLEHWKNLGAYITAKNFEAQRLRFAKRAAKENTKGKGKA
jgi:hypothetical protein